MFYRYCFFMLALATGFSSRAQNSLTGYITAKSSHQPVAFANVYLPDLHKSAATDTTGKFTVQNLPKGKFRVVVSCIGYLSVTQKVDITGETEITVSLEESVTEFDALVVTGVSSAVERNKNPVPTEIVTHDDIEQHGSSNVVEAIARTPGVSLIGTGPAIAKPVIRGLGFNRTLVLYNGTRQEGQQWGSEHGVEIDEYSVDRVEIIKGPGSLMYGSDAMAGVINFLPPWPPEKGKIMGRFSSNYQTNNQLQGYSLVNAGNLSNFYWMLRGSLKQAGNYQNKYDGKVFNSGFREKDISGSVGTLRKWGYSNVHFSVFDQSLGLVEGERDSLGKFTYEKLLNDSTVEDITASQADLKGYEIFDPQQRITHLRVTTDNNVVVGKSRIAFDMGFQQNQRREFAPHMPGDDEPELHMELNTFTYGLKYFLPDNNKWETSLGVNGMMQRNKNKAHEYLVPDYNLADAGIFMVTQRGFKKLNLSGGMRYNYRSVLTDALILDSAGTVVQAITPGTELKFAALNRNFQSVSASVGASYNFNATNLVRINVARGYRAPVIPELASNGHHEGTLRYEIGNPDLKPESNLQLDAGTFLNTEHVSFELSGFVNHISNYIYTHKLSAVSGGDSTVTDQTDVLTVYQYVQDKAVLYGGEATLDIHPHPLDWLHWDNGFAFVLAQQPDKTDSTKYLPFIPAPQVTSELKAHFQKTGKHFKNLFVSAEIQYVFAQNRVYSAFHTETATPGYVLCNAGLGADVVSIKGKKLFTLYVSGTNLLDAAYQHHLNRLKYFGYNSMSGRTGVYNMGRNFSVRLIIPLEWKTATNP